MNRPALFDVISCNDVLMTAHAIARAVTLESARETAAAHMPRPAGVRRFARIVARPVGADSAADILLVKGEC